VAKIICTVLAIIICFSSYSINQQRFSVMLAVLVSVIFTSVSVVLSRTFCVPAFKLIRITGGGVWCVAFLTDNLLLYV
jgi:hypothetical protein